MRFLKYWLTLSVVFHLEQSVTGMVMVFDLFSLVPHIISLIIILFLLSCSIYELNFMCRCWTACYCTCASFTRWITTTTLSIPTRTRCPTGVASCMPGVFLPPARSPHRKFKTTAVPSRTRLDPSSSPSQSSLMMMPRSWVCLELWGQDCFSDAS